MAIFAIGLSRVAAAGIDGHITRRLPEILLGLAIPVVIVMYMLKLSKNYPTASPMSPLKLRSAIELAGSSASCPWQDRACRVGLASPHD